MKIPKKFLTNLAVEIGAEYKDLELAYLELLKIVRKTQDVDDATAQRKALSRLVNEITRQKRKATGGGSTFTGVVVGDTGAYDDMEERKRIAKAIYKKDPERAVVDGFTDAEGNPLDRRPKVMGRDNPNYGKPITWKEMMRRVYFIDDSEKALKVLILRDAMAVELEHLVPGTQIKFTGREYKSGIYLGDGERVTVEESKITEEKLAEIARGADGYIPLEELEDFVANEEYRVPVITEGEVVDTGRFVILNNLERGVKLDAEIRVSGAIGEEVNRDDVVLVVGDARAYDVTTREDERIHITEIAAAGVIVIEPAFSPDNVVDASNDKDSGDEDIQLSEEQEVLAEELKKIITELDKGNGVKLVDILPRTKAAEDVVIDVLDALALRGDIYEPKIGRFKVVA